MSGLTVGYSSIDYMQLEIKLKNGTEDEKKDAQRILPILNRKHLLLSTLLLSNALAMESLPIFLDAIMPAALAILVSTSIVLVFGEVVPQAICIGPNQIKIAAQMAPIVNFLITILYFICYPISKGLDYFLGDHAEHFRFAKKDLKALIQLHEGKGPGHEGEEGGNGLSPEEINIITSTIDLRETTVDKIMIKWDDIFRLNQDEVLDDRLMKRIAKHGYSRIPIFDSSSHCVGILRAKSLINAEEIRGFKLRNSSVRLDAPIIISTDANLLETLSLMEQKKTSVVLISGAPSLARSNSRLSYRSRADMLVEHPGTTIVGLLCLKDIFEKIIEKDFEDQDMHFKSIMSVTWGGPKYASQEVKMGRKNNELIEMVDQEEHNSLKRPLIKK